MRKVMLCGLLLLATTGAVFGKKRKKKVRCDSPVTASIMEYVERNAEKMSFKDKNILTAFISNKQMRHIGAYEFESVITIRHQAVVTDVRTRMIDASEKKKKKK